MQQTSAGGTDRILGLDLNIFVQYGLDFVLAIVLLLAGFVVAKIFERLTLRSVSRITPADQTLPRFLSKAARYFVLVLVLIMVLAQFGVQTTSIIAALGAAGIAIGLALQGTLSNIAAGIMLLVLKPFKVGEFIEAGGTDGTVEEIGLFATELRAADGVFRLVPNNQIWNSLVTNYSRNPSRRFEIAVGIDYEDDLDRARDILLQLAKADSRVLPDPEPMTLIKSLGESEVTVALRGWTATADYWASVWDLTRGAKLAFDEAGITIPYPQRTVHVRGGPLEASGAD